MSVAEMKQEVTHRLDRMSDEKVATVYDFVQFLAEREERTGWAAVQGQSAAYREWVGSENDMYDEVFTDARPTR